MKKRLMALALAAALLFVAGCGNSSSQGQTPSTPEATKTAGIPKEKIKVGFVYIGVPGDEGYTYAQDQGRKALESQLGVKTVTVENVPESSEVETAIRNLIDGGANVIFATSFGYMEYVADLAKQFPNVYFFHCSGSLTDKNLSTYFGKIENPRYLSGIAAGLKTQTNKIGYVAAMPIPEVIRGIDAFALGVKSVNPNAKVEVVWTNTWYDPSLEKSAAIELLNRGADVIAQHQDTTSAQIAAEEAGKFAIGYNSPTPKAAPKAYLTAPIWDWSKYFIPQVQSIIDGTYKSGAYWGPEVVALDKLTDLAAPGTQEAVDAAAKKIAGGYNIFTGPIVDNQGKAIVEQGKTLTDEQVWVLDRFVDNVVGSTK